MPRMKTLKLSEITKPLHRDNKEILLLRAVQKLLESERNSSQALHEKVVTTLAATFSKSVRQSVLTFLLTDLRSHVNVALAWLYEEYSIMQVSFSLFLSFFLSVLIEDKNLLQHIVFCRVALLRFWNFKANVKTKFIL